MSTRVLFKLKVNNDSCMAKAYQRNGAKIKPDSDEPEPEPKWIGRTDDDKEGPQDDDNEDSPSSLYEHEGDLYHIGDQEEGGEAETGQESAA